MRSGENSARRPARTLRPCEDHRPRPAAVEADVRGAENVRCCGRRSLQQAPPFGVVERLDRHPAPRRLDPDVVDDDRTSLELRRAVLVDAHRDNLQGQGGVQRDCALGDGSPQVHPLGRLQGPQRVGSVPVLSVPDPHGHPYAGVRPVRFQRHTDRDGFLGEHDAVWGIGYPQVVEQGPYRLPGEVVPEPGHVAERGSVHRDHVEAVANQPPAQVVTGVPQDRACRVHSRHALEVFLQRRPGRPLFWPNERPSSAYQGPHPLYPDVAPGGVEHPLREAPVQGGAEARGEDAQPGGEDEQQRQTCVVRRVPGHLPCAHHQPHGQQPRQQPAQHAHHQREEPQEHHGRGY